MRDVIWMGDSLGRLKTFPEEVQDGFGYLLHQVQLGKVPSKTKQLRGLKPSVMELIADFHTKTFRVIYTVKFQGAVYVLHCFQKKSKFRVKTPKPDMNLINRRLREGILLDDQH